MIRLQEGMTIWTLLNLIYSLISFVKKKEKRKLQKVLSTKTKSFDFITDGLCDPPLPAKQLFFEMNSK